MRHLKLLAALLAVLLLTACGAAPKEQGAIAATTAPVAQFAQAIVEGTDLSIAQVVTDSVSCLHDYSLSVRQMETIEKSPVVLISGAGLEGFMGDALKAADKVVDCSEGVELRQLEGHDDPHIWLDPSRAKIMAENICLGLSEVYPEHKEQFRSNTDALVQRLEDLRAYGEAALQDVNCRELITFHDGFSYLAESMNLEILAAVEEESGSEASAADLMEIIDLVKTHNIPAIFTEKNGSDAAASVIHAETGAAAFQLDTAMGGSDYFDAMTNNFDTLKEALQ